MTDYKEHKKKRNDGFTLVELIVVIVILAILAAILVPALLGYIDKAKKSKVYLNAKNCLTATQAMLSQYYAEGKALGKLNDSGGTYVYTAEDDGSQDPLASQVLAIADPPEGYDFIAFGCDGNSVDKDGNLLRSGYTIKFFLYSENRDIVYYHDGMWQDGSWEDLSKQADFIYVISDSYDNLYE
jgi:prepilin-type N-terminal cleavage/methylation domain-containing protein